MINLFSILLLCAKGLLVKIISNIITIANKINQVYRINEKSRWKSAGRKQTN